MSGNNIDNYLRENKPRVKDNDTFMLEVANKLDALEGIKTEVDRQRKTGRIALISALVTGFVVGTALSVFIILSPVNPVQVPDAFLSRMGEFLEKWKYPVYLLAAGCATALGLVLPGLRGKRFV